MKQTAIITGITGQIGSYMAELLLEKGYKVYGLKRRTSDNNLGCVAHLEKEIEIVEGDLLDLPSLLLLCNTAKANIFINFAAQSHVGSSFTQPIYTAQCTGIGVLNCLEAIRLSGIHTKFIQSSTSELFGGQLGETYCNEKTPFHPRSPYGVAKQFGYEITRNYREAYKFFACNGIFFNTESPRRGPNFVTRKITQGVAKIKLGLQNELYLGNLDAKRDWGHAKDVVRGIYLMTQHHTPDDFIFASGITRSVKDFCKIAFSYVDLDWQDYVKIDPRFYRPCEVDVLLGDYSKADKILGWSPNISFPDLVDEMVESDLKTFSLML